MDFALAYLTKRFFFRIADFFHHWYVDGTRSFTNSLVSFLEKLDKTFAVFITLKLFFRPLYGDYSFVGRIFGIVFRTFRVLLGSAVYIVVFVAYVAVYLAWLFFPPLLLFLALQSLSK